MLESGINAVKTSAPAKLILFGEWAVLDGAPALATALSPRLSLELEIRQRALGFELWSVDEATREVTNFRWDKSASIPHYFEFSTRLLASLGISPTSSDLGLLARWTRSWKLEEGLGSSSAVALTAIFATRAMFGEDVPEESGDLQRFWFEAREILREAQGGLASGLDLAAQLFGGSVVLEAHGPKAFPLVRPEELMVIHTGRKANTARALRDQKRDSGLMQKIGDSSAHFLSTLDWREAIESHYEALKELGVVPDFVESAREQWIAEGLVETLKTTGAGGGDALLAWVRPGALPRLTQDIRTRQWWISSANWNAEGARIDDLC